MRAVLYFIQRTWRHLMSDSMRRNSVFLMLGAAVGSAIGFFFWLLCARLFQATDVGYAVSIISCVNLAAAVTALGLNNAVVRFLPHHERKAAYISTVFGITTLSSLVIGAGTVAGLGLIAKQLAFIASQPLLFLSVLLLIVVTTLGMIADAVLLAHKDGRRIFMKTVWGYPLRLVLPFLFAGYGLRGIILTYGLTSLAALLYQAVVIIRHYRGEPLRFSLSTLQDTYRFTAGNVVGTIFGILPSTVVPLIVLAKLGPEQAAFLYIPMQIASLLSIISSSSAQSFMAEASHERSEAVQRHHLARAARHLFSLLIPGALVLALVGSVVLHLYGPQYAQAGEMLLLLLCVSSVFVGVNWLGDALLNVQKRPLAYGVMNAVNAVLVCVLAYGAAAHGLGAVGGAWLAGQVLTVIIYAFVQLRLLRGGTLFGA